MNSQMVVIVELPEEEQLPFRAWLIGQTCPIIEGKGDCAYGYDYKRWKKAWDKGKTARVID